VPDTNRAAALSAAVALTTAHLDGVEIDRDLLAEGLTDRQVADAAIWLARMVTEHSPSAMGPEILKIVGQVAGWVDSGGQ
jgi:hypothetical protein